MTQEAQLERFYSDLSLGCSSLCGVVFATLGSTHVTGAGLFSSVTLGIFLHGLALLGAMMAALALIHCIILFVRIRRQSSS